MITLAFLLVSTSLFFLLAIFDAMLFHFSILESLRNILISEISAGRYIVIAGAILGMAIGVIIDIRLFLKKKKGKNLEGNQG